MRSPIGTAAGILLIGAVLQGHPIHAACTTVYEYEGFDVTRTYVQDETRILSDTRNLNDALGRRIETVQGFGDPAAITTRYIYDVEGRVVTQAIKLSSGAGIDANDVRTVYTYDRLGRQRVIAGPSSSYAAADKPVTLTEYDATGNIVRQRVLQSATPEVWAETLTEYDALNRPVRVTDPEGHYRQMIYDPLGHVIREYAVGSSATGLAVLSQTRHYYDNAGRLTREARMLNASSAAAELPQVDNVVDYVYDAAGRVITRTTYNMNSATGLATISGYDGHGRLTRASDPLGGTEEYQYTPDGLLTRRKGFDGRWQTMEYDDYARMTHSVAEGASPLATDYAYDCLGRRAGITDPNGYLTTYAYDLLGRQVMMIEDDGASGALKRTTAYEYSPRGVLTKQIAVNTTETQVTEYGYAPIGQVSSITYPDSTGADDRIDFVYSPNGRVITKIEQGQSGSRPFQVYSYDKRGLLTAVLASDTTTKGFIYDGLGRMVTARKGTTQDAISTSETFFAYDDLSRAIKETQRILGASGPVKVLQSSYDQAGNRRRLVYPRSPQ